jgi:hypothetical protein
MVDAEALRDERLTARQDPMVATVVTVPRAGQPGRELHRDGHRREAVNRFTAQVEEEQISRSG